MIALLLPQCLMSKMKKPNFLQLGFWQILEPYLQYLGEDYIKSTEIALAIH